MTQSKVDKMKKALMRSNTHLLLSAVTLFQAAAMLLIAWDGDSLRGFRFYRQAQTLSEYAQLALLAAVIVPPCVEEWTR